MPPEIRTIAALVPFAIFAAALVLRIATDAHPDSAASAHYRRALLIGSYVCIAIGLISIGIFIFIDPILGVTQLLLFTLGAAQLADVEAIIGGQRRRAQQAELLWMLASTVRSQGNLADELELFASGTWGWRHRRLMELVERLRRGTPLSEIVVPQGLLPHAATIEIQAGLQAGRLHEALQAVAKRHTREIIENSSSTKMQLTLMHPAMVMAAAVLVVGYLMVYIVPKYKKIFSEFNTALPEPTKIVFAMSDSFVALALTVAPLIYLPVLAALIIGIAEFYGWRTVSRRLFGGWSVRPYVAELLRSLSQCVAGGLPLPTALQGLTFTSASHLLHRRLGLVRVAVEQGQSCWKQLELQRFLNAREVALLESAEAVGNLPWTLNTIADSIERRWTFRSHALLEVFGPVISVVLGSGVLFLFIAFFLPMVNLLAKLAEME